jgi:hypothetical protein
MSSSKKEFEKESSTNFNDEISNIPLKIYE